MTPIIAQTTLSILGSILRLQGNPEAADTIQMVLSAYRAGKNVDAHMVSIAEKLEAGDELDSWMNIQGRLDAEVNDFLRTEDTVASNSEPEPEPGQEADPVDPPGRL